MKRLLRFRRKKTKGQHAPFILTASWWTILLGYFVASRGFLLREQPFVLDWIWWTLLVLPLIPSIYSSFMMRRVAILRASCHPFHLGNHGSLEISVANKGRLPVPALSIWNEEHQTEADLNGRQVRQLKLPIEAHQRGTTQAPPLRAQTLFPFSMFTTWKDFQTDGEYVVYPEPEHGAPAWPDTLEHGSRKVRRGEDVVGFRQHRHDDPLNIVDWKASAKTGQTVVREYQDQDSVLHFDWEQVSELDTEHAVSRLTSWILMADNQGRSYCLDLPGEEGVPPDAGDAQRHACLRALADFRRPK